jgi:hypothetical protein
MVQQELQGLQELPEQALLQAQQEIQEQQLAIRLKIQQLLL